MLSPMEMGACSIRPHKYGLLYVVAGINIPILYPCMVL